MYAEERQQAIARLVSERRRLSVTDLARAFDVTTETVRRDLSQLERLGLVRRVHGGAVPAETLSAIEMGLSERDQTHADRKELIAKAALSQLPGDGASVLMDAGSTTARLASLFPQDRDLMVFTHSVPVASRLAGMPRVDLHLLPGRVRPTTQAAVGASTVAALHELRVDLAFVGTNGLDRHGLTTPDPDEAATKRALVAAARRTVVLADSSKIGEESAVRFADLDQIDCLVTDAEAPPTETEALRKADIEVVIA